MNSRNKTSNFKIDLRENVPPHIQILYNYRSKKCYEIRTIPLLKANERGATISQVTTASQTTHARAAPLNFPTVVHANG